MLRIFTSYCWRILCILFLNFGTLFSILSGISRKVLFPYSGRGLVHTLPGRGWSIWPGFFKVVLDESKRPPTTQNLIPNEYFDLWLSKDTKNSLLCVILLPLQAVKCRRSKIKFFKPKKVKISNFELQMCNIPQKKAENMYNKDSARKSKISHKKIDFFAIFWFFT